MWGVRLIASAGTELLAKAPSCRWERRAAEAASEQTLVGTVCRFFCTPALLSFRLFRWGFTKTPASCRADLSLPESSLYSCCLFCSPGALFLRSFLRLGLDKPPSERHAATG